MNHFSGSERRMEGDLAGTILYVEDEAFVREVVAEVLRAAGYRVLVTKNAAEAADTFQGWGSEIDLLLTDVILPGETGQMLAVRLKRRNARLKVLYVTGYAEQMAMPPRVNEECLAKPFSTEALLERVKRMIVREDCRTGTECAAMLACAGV